MKIFLFGVSNVGKTTMRKLLDERLSFTFYDQDDEVKLRLRTEYYGAAEPPVRCGVSRLSGLTEPPVYSYSA